MLHNRRVRRRLLEHWRRPQFALNTQQTLRRLEAGHFSEASKRELILSALYSDNPAQYLPIVVCRWSLELPTKPLQSFTVTVSVPEEGSY